MPIVTRRERSQLAPLLKNDRLGASDCIRRFEPQQRFPLLTIPTTRWNSSRPWIYSSKYNLNLDLSQVQMLTTDAIAALIATIRRLDVDMTGNLPDDSNAQTMLLESGFFTYVSSTQPLPSTPHGTIEQKTNTIVAPATAKNLVHFGTKGIFGTSQRNRPSYSTLIECMANTKGHAAGRIDPYSRTKKPPETWWATVYADSGRKKICFTFVDTGVGIFRSIRIRVVRKIYDFFGGKDDTDILRDMLDGKVPSSTTL